MASAEPTTDLLRAQALLYRHTLGLIRSMAIKSAVDHSIPDIIHGRGRPVTLSELEADLQVVEAKGDALRRLMRLLVHMDFFSVGRDGEEDTYDLTTFSRLLLQGSPNSLWRFVDGMLSPVIMSAWNHLGGWFKVDQPTTFHMAVGMSLWDAASKDPEINECLNELMAGDSRLLVDMVVKEAGHAFQGLRSLVDVGGGTGSTAKVIAAAFPDLKYTVFDLPHVVATAAPQAANVEFVGGDMFDHIPRADAVLLKWILHDWSDDDCVKILKRAKAAIPPRERGGKVIVIDVVVNSCKDDPEVTEAQYLFDMTMVAILGGKEREEHEWRKIFTAAGFTDYKITHNLGMRSLIEVYP